MGNLHSRLKRVEQKLQSYTVVQERMIEVLSPEDLELMSGFMHSWIYESDLAFADQYPEPLFRDLVAWLRAFINSDSTYQYTPISR